jgi:hypothetical protein
MSFLIDERLEIAPGNALTKGGNAAEKIIKGNADALTESGNALRTARCTRLSGRLRSATMARRR